MMCGKQLLVTCGCFLHQMAHLLEEVRQIARIIETVENGRHLFLVDLGRIILRDCNLSALVVNAN